MEVKRYVMGLFRDEDRAVGAIESLKKSSFKIHKVHSPVPSHKIMNVLDRDRPQSKVGYFTLTGGIIGFFTGFFLAIYTTSEWSLIVSGKPVIALVPFFIVGFEFTILFGVLGNIIGLLTQARLPRWKNLKQYDERCSGEHFGVVAQCDDADQDRLMAFFIEKGGDAKRIYVY